MAVAIPIPKLGMTMRDAKIVEWKAQEGQWIEAQQLVLLIETAKVTYEVASPGSGHLHILAASNTVLKVGQAAGLLAETKEELARLQAEQPAPVAAAEAAAAAAGAAGRSERVKISPAARKMAEDHGLDLSLVQGTGPGGRIVKEDIEKALDRRAAQPAVAEAVSPPSEVVDGKRVKETIPLRGMRLAIAEHMQRSLAASAQLTSMGEIDMTEAIRLRSSLLAQESQIGARVTYTDIFVMALAKALKTNPIVNSSIVDGEIKIWEDINIGVAVALEDGTAGGLIVPVIRNADRKSLVDINRELRSAVEKARAGKLMPDDVTGSTFTLTNLGGFGGGYGFGTPIINQPESAILGTGAISDRAVVRDGQIVIRPIMTFSFTFDHRVFDGAPAGKFVGTLTQLLQDPHLLLI